MPDVAELRESALKPLKSLIRVTLCADLESAAATTSLDPRASRFSFGF